MEATVLFVNATKIHQFKVSNSEIKKKSIPCFQQNFQKMFLLKR